jgi:hypothetical protein
MTWSILQQKTWCCKQCSYTAKGFIFLVDSVIPPYKSIIYCLIFHYCICLGLNLQHLYLQNNLTWASCNGFNLPCLILVYKSMSCCFWYPCKSCLNSSVYEWIYTWQCRQLYSWKLKTNLCILCTFLFSCLVINLLLFWGNNIAGNSCMK